MKNYFPARTTNLKFVADDLSVLIEILIRILPLTGTLVLTERACRTETLAITLAGVYRFELRLLSGRNEMRVFLQILDDFFCYHFTLKTAQRAFNRFVVVN